MSQTVWNEQYERYYSEQGATYIDKATNLIRTSYSAEEFTESIIKMLEVNKNMGDAKCKYRTTRNQYAKFAEKMKLPMERQRVYADGLGRVINGGIERNYYDENGKQYKQIFYEYR